MKVDTKKLLELCEKATPGEWSLNRISRSAVVNDKERLVATCGGHTSNVDSGAVQDENEANAQYITACDPTTVKSLCTELDRARELLEKVAKYGTDTTTQKEIRAFLQDDKRGGV